MSTKALIDQHWEQIVADHRWLHAHPELSGKEEKTAAYIAESLKKMGLEVQENVGGHGVVALIEGSKPGKCVALRADFDALPVTECTGLPYASENPGVMHACGHDVHTAMLLGAARVLCNMRDAFSGSVKLIFQPAEEKGGGAQQMIEDGVLQDPPVEAIFAQHLGAMTPTGSIVYRNGAMMGASDGFTITVHGKGAHASTPERGVDAITISAQVISALQNIVSRSISPFANVVMGIGTISGGTAHNIVAEAVEMTGTCRNVDLQLREELPKRMEAIIKAITESMGGGYSFQYRKGYPPVINDEKMCNIVRVAAAEVIDEDRITQQKNPSLGAEDFAYYAERVPGAMFILGCKKEGTDAFPLHSGRFAPDEECMRTGVYIMASSAIRFLNGN